MPNLSQRVWTGQVTQRLAKQKAADQIVETGMSLPCHVTKVISAHIVVVAFDVQAVSGHTPLTLQSITLPVLGSQWFRSPIQVGTQGSTIAADVYLGGVSGLGGGTAVMARPLNLDGLMFSPLGQTNWPTALGSYSINPNMATVYGPAGAVLSDTAGENMVVVSSGGTVAITAQTSITLTVGGKTIVINSSGITLDGILWDTHQHQGGNGGTGLTGGPQA
jgi:hypothetical protein